jgi:hypothetical protein
MVLTVFADEKTSAYHCYFGEVREKALGWAPVRKRIGLLGIAR